MKNNLKTCGRFAIVFLMLSIPMLDQDACALDRDAVSFNYNLSLLDPADGFWNVIAGYAWAAGFSFRYRPAQQNFAPGISINFAPNKNIIYLVADNTFYLIKGTYQPYLSLGAGLYNYNSFKDGPVTAGINIGLGMDAPLYRQVGARVEIRYHNAADGGEGNHNPMHFFAYSLGFNFSL